MELSDYLNVIRARWRIIVIGAVVVPAVALLATLLVEPTYRGEVKVLVAEQNTRAALFGEAVPELSSQPERGQDTQVQLLQLRPLFERVIDSLDLETTPESLARRVAVKAVGGSNVVTVEVKDSDAILAAKMANAIAEAYVEWSRELKRENMRIASEEIAELTAADAEERAADAGDGAQCEILKEMDKRLNIYEELEFGSASIVESATVDSTPVSPKRTLIGVLALTVGMLFGLAAAFVVDYADNTIKDADDAASAYGAPVLGEIPSGKPARRTKRR